MTNYYDDMNTDDLQDTVKRGLVKLQSLIDESARQVAEIEALPRVRASEWWKQDKYLYLVHPTDKNGKRTRQYIGADPDKVAEARASISRYYEHDELARKHLVLVRELRHRKTELHRLANYLHPYVNGKG